MLNWRAKRVLLGVVIATIFMITHFNLNVYASSRDFHEQNVQFKSGDIVLNGTLLIPDGPGPHPAIILIHGAGVHTREEYRAEAEIFTKSGIAALIYDKRTIGYSADGVGEQSRSYALLADDVLAAVEALRSREELNQKNIGLWGLSEGSSVAPLAAVQSSKVAFIITVSPSGVPPAQQTSWAMENEFRQQGITSSSFIHSIAQTGIRFLVSAGMFAEATYDHVPPLEQLRQPILAIWGSNDRTAPPVESYQIMHDALERGGNGNYTFQFIPEANHDLRLSPDGFISSEQFAEQFAPGYAVAMTSWVDDVINGKEPKVDVIGEIPQQNYISSAGVAEPSWYDSVWLQLGIIIILITVFLSYYGIALFRLFKKRKVNPINTRLQWYARIISILGIVSVLGFFGYFGYIMIMQDIEPVVFGRPLPWLILQFFALLVCTLSVLLALSWWRSNNSPTVISERVRLGLLLVGSILFIPWALYWKLLML